MTAAPVEQPTVPAVPSRFRSAEARSVAMGHGLRRFGRVRGPVDEALMTRLGEALLQRDEPAAAVADAIRTRAPGHVTHAQLRAALHEGIDAVPDAPPVLVDFLQVVSDVPHWVDWDLVDRGAEVFTRLGTNAADSLLQLSLIGGYRFGGPSDLLVRTGGLTGRQTRRRLAETQHWAVTLDSAASLRPGGEGWRTTVHVRVMHALVNAVHEPTWDVARWGPPINIADQVGTLGLFDGTLILGCRALGVPIGRHDSRALMHLWRYVGWLMGVPEEFLTDNEWERHRINYHVLLSAPRISDAGPGLAQAILDIQTQRRWTRWPRVLWRARGRFEQERMLSTMTAFLGARSMRELGLGVRPPWALVALLVLNTWRYRVLDRLPNGAARRLRWGRRTRARILDSYFAGDYAEVAELPRS